MFTTVQKETELRINGGYTGSTTSYWTTKDYSGNDCTCYYYDDSSYALGLFSFSMPDRMSPRMCALNNTTYCYYANQASNSSSYLWGGVYLGDGDTTPTENDYALSGNIITDYTAATSIKAWRDSDGTRAIAVYTITNTGSASFTVKELGLIRANARRTPTNRVLLSHEILDTPLTLAPGETGVLMYTIETEEVV